MVGRGRGGSVVWIIAVCQIRVLTSCEVWMEHRFGFGSQGKVDSAAVEVHDEFRQCYVL